MVSSGVSTALQRCLIIAEAGVNHNGSEDNALRLVDAAVAAGADIVKFQTFKAERLVTRAAKKAAYQETQTGEGDQYSMLKALELDEDAHARIARHCAEQGIEFLSTGFDEASTDFLLSLGIRRLKLPSGELTNAPFVRFLASKGLPLIVSTGMATLDEVAQAVDWVRDARQAAGQDAPLIEVLTLLHCTSNYPTPLTDVNLLAMRTLQDRFGLPVGYSDHTAGIFVAPLARTLGARVFEKHFTLDRSMPGPDHAASLEPAELARMISAIRDTELILGDGFKAPTGPELEVRVAARRSVTLAGDVQAGQQLRAEDLTLMRPGNGIPPAELDSVVGCTVIRSMHAGDTLRREDIAP
ncbi:N-acetylneuraminate synthase [Methyloversatilis sp.]|uniref:N-acetylneuraminate synthase n=1 Tax=Methyloversatilis sp. TaxID=2569862 RepID=UPI0027333D77|nr:N-acetylneuraminate synthase [Methyloversatilis sp.]MDP2870399.1 N-acetylneuraminate synthase [Methyloversatilis sp.]MDP3457116.1 N-acetylneuraminate synthase [Methyloversatilis sp.]MDP3576797.1 N-acetylneuraminate synthase [Methyloversatilis sp.]